MVSFTDLSWAALLNYYKSNGDKRYLKLMSDKSFVHRLRTAPHEILPEELEQKLILDHVNIINFDLLVACRLAEQILKKIDKVQPEIRAIQDFSIVDVDPFDPRTIDCIQTIYRELSQVNGLWLTGVSKIAHVLNDQLLPIMGLDVIDRFPQIREQGFDGVSAWLKQIHVDAATITEDYRRKGFSGNPETYLSDHLGYTAKGIGKSLVKFLDEYYWIFYGEELPLPPKWIPCDKKDIAV
ncbi:hypothetical protein [Dehalogenimonas etheniformans]|uniref:Uncharacterized protein n=1 Tax=Dehalogenimonas etheniformans TaxID=1536648 RepID=A0A2P5P8Q9_9CHLR|nr:hypothetical protein [Dehalogenimonas etheniformans]PPD58676.1 hypothetical protein JP09_002025 [Dehalogenimonas etheniformans]QNT76553.1 hypothetical protein HX448_07595 [Dehalogenimonas etheniformans]